MVDVFFNSRLLPSVLILADPLKLFIADAALKTIEPALNVISPEASEGLNVN